MIDPKQYRILVVDDDPDVLLFLESFLCLEGFEVVTASSGLEAIQKAGMRKIDLVVMDLAMPGLDGLGTLRALRKKAPALPSVLVTAYRDGEKIAEAFRLGATDCVFKPLDTNVLKESIYRKLGK